MKLSAEQIAGIVHRAGQADDPRGTIMLMNPDTDGPIFVAIALTESKGETTAKNTANRNGTTDFGLWQINSVHQDLLDAYKPWDNPNNNFYMAQRLYSGRGGKFTDWSTYNSGLYAVNMPAATKAWGKPNYDQASTQSVDQTGQAVGEQIDSLSTLWATLSKSETWVRVGMGVGGAVLMLVTFQGLIRKYAPLPPGPMGQAVKAVIK
jgi:hypothetical protein